MLLTEQFTSRLEDAAAKFQMAEDSIQESTRLLKEAERREEEANRKSLLVLEKLSKMER